jgi:glycosyltransferase involved in cell wall biosynthesis
MVGVDTTIVIPVRDEKATIAAMVGVLTTDKPLATRILLVDAGSTDGTVQIAQDLARTHDLVDIIEVGAVWPGRARNIGIAASSTQWILLLDAGVDVGPDLVGSLIDARDRQPHARMIIGSYACLSTPRWRSAVIIATKPARSECDGRRGRYDFIPCLIEREFFCELGGFHDWRAGEDLDFVRRARSQADTVICTSNARIIWEMAPTRSAMIRKWATYSFHNARNGTSWHRPVLGYAVLGFGLAVAAYQLVGWWALTAPLAPHLTRTIVRYRRHCCGEDDEVRGGALVFSQALAASLLADLATLFGVLRWCLLRGMGR